MSLPARLDPIDRRITTWLARHGVTLTRLALGVVFLWFGALKFVSGWSPAADLASRNIQKVTFDLVRPEWGLPILAAWESPVGIGLLTGRFLRTTRLLFAFQLAGARLAPASASAPGRPFPDTRGQFAFNRPRRDSIERCIFWEAPSMACSSVAA